MRQGVLRYDGDFDRWCFDEGDARESLHCGEALAVRMADRHCWGRMEMDRGEWIFIIGGKQQTVISLRKETWYSARMRT